MEKKNNINYGNDDLKKSFKVPENYFEDFAASFEQKIVEQPVSVKHIMRPWMYMAAMFLGVFFIAQIFYTVYFSEKNDKDLAQSAIVSDKEKYELYLKSQIDDNMFYEYLMEGDDASNN
jgi:hypothetical protein